ncbi:alpha/beta fold hydrolase [Gracilibacillus alcaliphilus]|uniref:alpha/beta fold hydrolase n=1 Tax=Gracilibacillus alcaliphilus TaxID=1401441 RepID=UPI001958A961|nr:alpha/beta hydrolase [Gracilibacillus alcaliphilus]MBM7678110.1 pimeloyl-ACP methyl ester carboxylesterase [Gracilibacillus alcaliphilus]
MKFIFLHGLGQTSSAWDEIVGHIGQDRCEAVSLYNELTADQDLTIERLDQKLTDYLAAIREPFILCGLSLGGILALRYAAEQHTMLKGLILSGTQYQIASSPLFTFQNMIFRILPQKMFTRMGLTKAQALQLMRSLHTLDMHKQLASIQIPTLVLCGERDKPNKKAAIELSTNIPNAKLELIAGGGHELNTELPEVFSEAIEQFMTVSFYSKETV